MSRLCLYYLGHVDPDRLGDLRPADHALGHTGGAGGAGDQVAAGEEHHPHLAIVMSVVAAVSRVVLPTSWSRHTRHSRASRSSWFSLSSCSLLCLPSSTVSRSRGWEGRGGDCDASIWSRLFFYKKVLFKTNGIYLC